MEMHRLPRFSPSGDLDQSHTRNGRSVARGLSALCVALVAMGVAPAAHAAVAKGITPTSAAAAAHPSRAFWTDLKGSPSQFAARGVQLSVQPTAFRAATLDRLSMTSALSGAPMEFTAAARSSPVVLSLPDPSGNYQRFAMVESPVMESGLAAKHPDIKTYSGKGLDDPTANIRISVTPLGFNASVRSAGGPWYIDPYYHLDQSVYASYFAKNLPNTRARAAEGLISESVLTVARGRLHAADKVQIAGFGFTPGAQVAITVRNVATDALARQTIYASAGRDGSVSASVVADPYKNLGSYVISATDGKSTSTAYYNVVGDAVSTDVAVGGQLRQYRLALVTDPTYATYFGGPPNVTPAKVALMNRVNQVYESETSIRMILINATDSLNLDTPALATGTNGPCGGSACFTAAQIASCGGGTLSRNRIVAGLIAGASNFDIGHIGVGVNGGGIASLGVVGAGAKAQGCTGIPTPVGDFYAVDYVAHEMGHQFSGNHTFNGTIANCSTGNRSPGTSVEPGSGSSVMAYAGICGTDNLQSHSDAYWSQRSFDEITSYTSGAEVNIAEVQMPVLIGYSTTGQQYQFSYNGNLSAPIIRGTNNTAAGIKAAIEGIAGWPAAATVTASAVGDTAITLTFAAAAGDVPNLQLVNCTGGCSGFVGEITKGGTTTKGGYIQTATGNSPPVVNAPTGFTIPVRTPFYLTGSATDPDGDTVTYMWEQNNVGIATTGGGTGLITQPKTNGPLFRQFGTRAIVSSSDTLLYNSPGENVVGTNPTRFFPDMAQILANNTNAESGACPTADTAPTGDQIDCFSEYLPTAAYVGITGQGTTMLFRLTGRDGKGGINSASTTLTLAPTAGPFLVTSPNTAVTYGAGSSQTVTWNVANTDIAPVSTSNVKISLSIDSGLTYPIVLAANAPNTGSAVVTMPGVATTTARIKVEAVGNVFFDVSNADFSIVTPPVLPPVRPPIR